jgi:cation:H+ antiporter
MAEVLFTGLVLDVIIIAVSFVILNWASSLAIGNAVKISSITGLGKTAVGFSLIAFSTSLPELTVAAIAAVSGGAPVSVGNVLGSNIVNISMVIGLAAILVHLKKSRKKLNFIGMLRHIGKHLKFKEHETVEGVNIIPPLVRSELSSIYFGLFISSIVPMVLIYLNTATWIVGLVLLFIFVGYMYQLSKVRIPDEDEAPVKEQEKSKVKKYLMLTLVGVIGVVVSAYFLVESAVSIATSAGLSQQVIGATIIAIGTSLPELTMDLKAFLRGHGGLAFGDIIGSSFVNITLILGITLFVPFLIGTPVNMNMSVFQNLIVFSIITNLFLWYFLSREKIGWQEGVVFLGIYAIFLATTLGVIQVPTPSTVAPLVLTLPLR